VGLIDFILNLAGILVWLSWRSLRFDPLIKSAPATLVGTLRRAEPRRLKGWRHLAGLAALLLLRALLYWQLGPEAGWTPKLNFFFVVLAFRSDLLIPTLVFSLLSFARLLIICYFWLLVLAIINRRNSDPDPVQRMVRLHVGLAARWPWPVQLLSTLFMVTALWVCLHPLLVQLEIAGRVRSFLHLAEQGLLVATALVFSLQYLLPLFLLLHLVASYVYLGSSPLLEFISATARNILAPLRRFPFSIGRLDFTPLIGTILILAMLHLLPKLFLGEMAKHNLSSWPQ
jgi:uncharacterized protein YggT (Ycf19 family)